MKLLQCLALGLLIVVATGIDDGEFDKKKTTVKPSTTSSTTASTPTASPSTTAEPTTPSTPDPSPTTSTSTPAPTTPSTPTPSPTSPSTPAPTTPSTPAPSPTTPAPLTTPSPHPPATEWDVLDPTTHHLCIKAAMNVHLTFHAGNVSVAMKIDPSSADAEGGSCGGNSTQQSLGLVWPPLSGSQQSKLLLFFNQKDKNYFISALNLSLVYNTTGGLKVAEFSSGNLTLFETTLNSSYSCAAVEIPELKNSENDHLIIKITDLHLEAFKTGNSTSFSSTHFCPGEVPDIVPLVVGICLAGLVLVVVVAYLIGRRRSQATGYLSM